MPNYIVFTKLKKASSVLPPSDRDPKFILEFDATIVVTIAITFNSFLNQK